MLWGLCVAGGGYGDRRRIHPMTDPSQDQPVLPGTQQVDLEVLTGRLEELAGDVVRLERDLEEGPGESGGPAVPGPGDVASPPGVGS